MHRLEPALWDIKRFSHGIMDYFSVCADAKDSYRERVFPKDKLWMTKAIKSLLNRKKRAFRALGQNVMWQNELKRRMEDGKNTYQESTESNLQKAV